MSFPAFFDLVPRVRLRDPLADFLGAAEGGLIDYGYADAVRLAGHSCPTVASAYWLTWRALKALYGDGLPERGAIGVGLREGATDGVAGVMAAVVTLITGATVDTGFKGLAGQFDRRHLLAFGEAQPCALRFTRLDTGATVHAEANLRAVPADGRMGPLMQRCLAGEASAEEAALFRTLWQARVRRVLLDHAHDPDVFVIRHANLPGDHDER